MAENLSGSLRGMKTLPFPTRTLKRLLRYCCYVHERTCEDPFLPRVTSPTNWDHHLVGRRAVHGAEYFRAELLSQSTPRREIQMCSLGFISARVRRARFHTCAVWNFNSAPQRPARCSWLLCLILLCAQLPTSVSKAT